MIRIKVKRLVYTSIEIEGHAGFDEPGKDIICAAVSALWNTMIWNLDRENIKCEVTGADGYRKVVIQEQSAPMKSMTLNTILDTILTGLVKLAEECEGYVAVFDLSNQI